MHARLRDIVRRVLTVRFFPRNSDPRWAAALAVAGFCEEPGRALSGEPAIVGSAWYAGDLTDPDL
jgi:hypothetical protein